MILNLLTNRYFYIFLAVCLIVGIVLYLTVKRNPFNKHKYIRLVKYNNDMTISIRYIKRPYFNLDGDIMIDPKHVFNFKGYQSIIISTNSQETINPLDFDSKFNPKDFKSAMKSKLIAEMFATLKVDKFDKITMLLILSGLQLITIVYLIYMLMGG